MIGLFRAFFSDAYRSFQQELNRFESAVHEPLSNAALLVAQKQVGDNAALAEFWRKYVSEGPPQISFEDAIQPTIRKLREALDPLVRKKVASPLEPVSYSHEANAAIEAWKRLRGEVQSYNERVAAFNRSVGAVKAAALGSKTPAAVQAEVSALEAKRVRYEPGTIDAVKAYAEAKAKKASVEAEKAKAKSELDTYNATVNRAPVLTLWATVVAERLGHPADAALTLGRAVAGLNAHSKGVRLGIYEADEKGAKRSKAKETVPLLGRSVPVVETEKGVRAAPGDRPIKPEAVDRYLRSAFGKSLDEVRAAMAELAGRFRPRELDQVAYELYEQFRPTVPAGKQGWGAKGELDLGLIRSLGGH